MEDNREILEMDEVKIERNGPKPPDKSKLRELISVLISHVPSVVKIGNKNDNGDISFDVEISDMGITPHLFKEYRKEILSVYFANFFGEMIVRENIEKFAEVLMQLSPGEYIEYVNKYGHKNFGMKLQGKCIVFTFHISLIQSILTEDFKYNKL